MASCLVASEDLELAEYCYKLTVNISQKPKDDPSVKLCKQVITAMLNTSGGVILLTSYSQEREPTFDAWMRDFEHQLLLFIPHDVYEKCVSFCNETIPLYIMVRRSDKLISVKTYLHIRHNASNQTLCTENESVKHILTRQSSEPCADPLPQQQFVQGSLLEVHESRSLEFKYWTVRDIETYERRLQVERTMKSLFALANLTSGGHIIIGVEEAAGQYTVQGQEISQEHEKLLRKFLKRFFAENAQIVPRIWGSEHISPEEGKHWSLQCIPVKYSDTQQRRRLIKIRLMHCIGGVFEQPPESYFVSSIGAITPMSFQEWRYRIVQEQEEISESENTQQATADGEDQSTIQHSNAENLQEQVSTQANHIAISSSTNTNKKSKGHGKSQMKAAKRLTWTENKHNWKENLSEKFIDITEYINDFTNESTVLRTSYPLNFTPHKETLLTRHKHLKDFEKAIASIEQVNGEVKGFGIVSPKWLSNIDPQNQIHTPQHQVMDVFVMNETGAIHFWTIINHKSDSKAEVMHVESVAWEYLFLCGRITKRALLNCDQTFYRGDITVQCHLYNLRSGVCRRSKPKLTIHVHDQSSHFQALRARLSAALFKQTSHVKNRLGCERGVYLTGQQMRNVMFSDSNTFNYIEGAPGSGKTYLALHVCSRFEIKEVGYVCTTVPFEAYLLFQHKCHPIFTKDESDLIRHIKDGRFNHFRCIVLDDVHNLPCSSETWHKLFQVVINHRGMQMFIFEDNRHQCFKEHKKAASPKKCLDNFCEEHNIAYFSKPMSDIHRNTKKVVSFISSCFDDDKGTSTVALNCTHENEGDDVEILEVNNYTESSPTNGIVRVVRYLMSENNSSENNLYEPSDIAILIDTKHTQKDVGTIKSIFKEHYPEIPIQEANIFPVTGLTIDTLDNF